MQTPANKNSSDSVKATAVNQPTANSANVSSFTSNTCTPSFMSNVVFKSNSSNQSLAVTRK